MHFLRLDARDDQMDIHEPQFGAVFADPLHAEAAVAELRQSGLADEHLGIAVHAGDRYVFEHSTEAAVGHGIGRGISIGAPIGAVAGMTVLALVVPGVGTIGVGGILAAGAMTGGLAGGLWGAYLGLTATEPVIENERDWERVALEPGQMIVVVDQHGHPEAVREVLERHNGRVVVKPAHPR
jgi:hypothetical protein